MNFSSLLRRSCLLAATAATVLAVGACSGDETAPAAGGATTSDSSTATAVTPTDPATAPGHNDADVMFAQMMIPHHAQAVYMSDLVLTKPDVEPAVLALAEQIKAAQKPEIDLMTGWLQAWGAPVDGMVGMGHSMSGLLSDAELQTLSDATGPVATVTFLEQMIRHHEGAIEMAEQQLGTGQDAEVKALSQQIISSQQAEIDVMQDLLDQP